MTDFEYSVRVSARASRLQLHVLPHGEVEVVLPRGMCPSVVPAFVARHEDWIARTRARLIATVSPIARDITLPREIHLPAIDRAWTVAYRTGLERAGVQEHAAGRLTIGCPDERGAYALLQHWLSRQGRLHLVPWLASVADELGLQGYRRVSIRGQRSRWGSYSSRGTLSLNRALLFLEPELVRHLFIHELCHTVHLNHSRRFWRLVQRHSPRWRELEQALNQAATCIPRWALVRR